MRKRNYGLFVLLTLVLLLSAGVRAKEAGSEVMPGSALFIHPSGMAFFVDGDTFGSALMGEDGTPYEMVTEGAMPYEITHIAFDGNYFYLNTAGGIYRAQIGGLDEAVMICDKNPKNGFYLYGDHIYYQYENALYRVSAGGGASEELAAGAEDYELTEAGIYYAQTEGGLYFLMPDGTGLTQLCDTPPQCHILSAGNYIYFWAESSSTLGFYSLTEELPGKLELPRNLSKYYFLATPEYFFYMDDTYGGVYRYDLASGEETRLAQITSVPFRDRCMFFNGYLYQYDQTSNALIYTDPANDALYRVETAGEDGPEPDIDYAETEYLPVDEEFMYDDGEFLINDAEQEAVGEEYETVGDYEIAAGIRVDISGGNALLTTDHFQIRLPMDGNWTWEVTAKDMLRIYHLPSANAGCGGSLVSIRAFEPGDDSYMEYPSWKMAGESGSKKYVAVFPTDMQADPQNPEGMEEYRRLFTYVQHIGTDNADNPFTVLDE